MWLCLGGPAAGSSVLRRAPARSGGPRWCGGWAALRVVSRYQSVELVASSQRESPGLQHSGRSVPAPPIWEPVEGGECARQQRCFRLDVAPPAYGLPGECIPQKGELRCARAASAPPGNWGGQLRGTTHPAGGAAAPPPAALNVPAWHQLSALNLHGIHTQSPPWRSPFAEPRHRPRGPPSRIFGLTVLRPPQVRTVPGLRLAPSVAPTANHAGHGGSWRVTNHEWHSVYGMSGASRGSDVAAAGAQRFLPARERCAAPLGGCRGMRQPRPRPPPQQAPP